MSAWKQAVIGLFAAAALAATATAQTAAPIVYDVELIVFQNMQPPGTPEDWALEQQIALKERPVVEAEDEGPIAADPATGLDTGLERKPLAREQFKMAALAAQLGRSRSYKPIAHFGWSQVGTPLNATTPLPLGDLLPAGNLTGSTALALGRYLHLTLDLSFQPEGSAQSYVLRQTRRMRSKERHYIDHPAFGVIALVTAQGK
ncbi:MAG: CsiV family protein [Steroidobacteraceae bacterium]